MSEPVDRVALVVGAGSGVGQAVAYRLGALGIYVGLAGRRLDELERTAAELRQHGGHGLPLPVDARDEADVAVAVEQLATTAGGIDDLVYCAGVGLYGPVETYTVADWEQTWNTNVTGLFLCARAVIPYLRQRGGGHIVAVSSGAGKRGYAERAAYAASKFAVHGFMESLAEELGPQRIKCSTVVPGSILTEFGATSVAEKVASGRKYLQPDDVAQVIVQILRQPDHAWTQEVNIWPF